MKTNPLPYQELELIYPEKEAKKNQSNKVFSWLNKAWCFVVDVLNRETEIKIQEKCDRQGNTYWYVYDPATNVSSYLATEEEVLSWIEERYYRQNTSYVETQSWGIWQREKM